MNNFNTISIFDTSIANYNTGNQIIMDSVNKELNDLFPQTFIIRLPVEDIKTNARQYNAKSIYSFVGGTNLLNGNIRRYKQWDLSLHNIMMLRNVVLMGCGWYQYEHAGITRFTKWALRKILSSNIMHSVRDDYTAEKLSSIGVKAINTGCPTLWRLTPEHLKIIPKSKRYDVVVTITDYNQNPSRDKKLLTEVSKRYEKVFFYPQGTGDIIYLRSLNLDFPIILLSPGIENLNNCLSTGCDYAGTRLHAGIRALQLGSRSFILGIDNRALEMKRDFNLPVYEVDNIEGLLSAIEQPYDLKLNLPIQTIECWKNQFK